MLPKRFLVIPLVTERSIHAAACIGSILKSMIKSKIEQLSAGRIAGRIEFLQFDKVIVPGMLHPGTY